MHRIGLSVILIAGVCTLVVCADIPNRADQALLTDDLTGAWRASIQFTTGTFAPVKDLEFAYVFNLGGTMTESSNYDALPPVPPAYGVWKSIGDGRFVARYEFYITRPPDTADGLAAGSGWLPAGHGVLIDTIAIADDGQSFTSRILYSAFDLAGNPVAGGGVATGQGRRIRF